MRFGNVRYLCRACTALWFAAGLTVLSALPIWSPGLKNEAHAAGPTVMRGHSSPPPPILTPSPSLLSSPSPPRTLLHSIAVIGKDSRRALNSTYSKMAKSVGILSFPDGRGCTAFCVGPDLVMSAAHCFYARQKNRKKNRLLSTRFILLSPKTVRQRAFSFLKGKTESEVENNVIVPRRRYINSVTSFRRDWALARLAKPVCKAPLKLLSISMPKLAAEAKKSRMVMIGIHGDKIKKGLLLSPGCRLRGTSKFRATLGRKVGLDRATMLHSCDMTKGSSGAPILLKTKEGLKVVAINVGVVGWTKWRRRRNHSRRLVSRARENIGVLTGPLQSIVDKLRREKLLTTSSQIKLLQALLNKNGLDAGPIDGKAGRRTRRAITKFEKRRGLPLTGIATTALLSALSGIDAR